MATPSPDGAYIAEFLYRGRPPGSDQEPAFHLIIALDGEDAFGRPTHAERILTMAEAAAEGWTLPAIIEAINAAAIAELQTKSAALQAATEQLDRVEEMSVEGYAARRRE